MPIQSKRPNLIRILVQVQHQEDMKRQLSPERELERSLARLRTWQCERLECTYSDLLADPDFAQACRFFLTDIYAPRDFSQRDHDFERLHALLSRVLPGHMLRLLKHAIDLNALTAELDQALLQALGETPGFAEAITPELYAEAYRRCDNYAARLGQIEQLSAILREVGEGARRPLVGASLRLARRPAHTAGWFELYDFLERGYAAFQPMKKPGDFADIIERRETRILNRIYSGEKNPFES
jgi:hypothetical protein